MKQAAIIVLLIAAFLSNPGIDVHVGAVLKKQIPYVAMLDGSGMLGLLAGAEVKNEMNYYNCLIFSFSSVPEQDNTITVGAFGFAKAF